jgi:iduronate 2-sulfatase
MPLHLLGRSWYLPFSFVLISLTTQHVRCLQSAESTKPNVLFLICDDLNCDLGSYGHPIVQSPNIDRLAARGVRFERAYCQYPLCGPSRASFMTGLYPDQTLIHRNSIYIRQHVTNVMTISQTFRSADYFATRIGKIYHYNVPKHIGTGGHDDPYSWNYTINPRGRDKEDESQIFSLIPGSFGGTLSWLAAEGSDAEQTDGIAATEAIEQLHKYAGREQPFYLAVGLYRPHTPYVAPKQYFERYPREKINVPQVPEGYHQTLPEPAVKSITRKSEHRLASDVARQAIQAYYASITFADAQIGRILDALDATGLADNTVVLFTSDHGYHMGEHGHWQKTTLFENAARVPLIIAGPGVTEKGKACTTPVEMVDFYPTLTELCGLEIPKFVSGVSLVPAVRDVSSPLRDKRGNVRNSAFTQYATGYSLRTERYRYSEWGPEGSDGAELYDHQDDPQELVNLAQQADAKKIIADLSQQLRRRIAEAAAAPPGIVQNRVDLKLNVPQPHD